MIRSTFLDLCALELVAVRSSNLSACLSTVVLTYVDDIAEKAYLRFGRFVLVDVAFRAASGWESFPHNGDTRVWPLGREVMVMRWRSGGIGN